MHGLPFHLKAGLIGTLQIKYHYMSALSNPVEVIIDELLVIFGPIVEENPMPEGTIPDNLPSDDDTDEERLETN